MRAECSVRCLCLIFNEIGMWQQMFGNTVWYQHLTTNCSAVRELRILSFGVWRRVSGWVLSDVSKDRGVCLLQAAGPSSSVLGLLDPEEEGITVGRNIRSYSPTGTWSHPQQYRCENLECRHVHYLLHANTQTDTHDEANRDISANFCCKRSENTAWFKKMDSMSYVHIFWTIRGMWMIYITFERGGPKFSNTTARALA